MTANLVRQHYRHFMQYSIDCTTCMMSLDELMFIQILDLRVIVVYLYTSRPHTKRLTEKKLVTWLLIVYRVSGWNGGLEWLDTIT